VFVRLRICPARIKLAASNFARWAGNLTFWGILLPQKGKIGRIGARRVDVGSACVDSRQSHSLAVLVSVLYAGCHQQLASMSFTASDIAATMYNFKFVFRRPSLADLLHAGPG